MTKFAKCHDQRGPICFACDRWGRCVCLGNTTQVPCPFFKTRSRVMEEDPHYYDREVRENESDY